MPKRGDIALVKFPYTDFSGEKIRPALVIAHSTDHAVTLFITSQSTGQREWNVKIAASKGNGLAVNSMIRCDKIASFDLRIVQGTIGIAPPSVLRAIDTKLRKLLKL